MLKQHPLAQPSSVQLECELLAPDAVLGDDQDLNIVTLLYRMLSSIMMMGCVESRQIHTVVAGTHA